MTITVHTQALAVPLALGHGFVVREEIRVAKVTGPCARGA